MRKDAGNLRRVWPKNQRPLLYEDFPRPVLARAVSALLHLQHPAQPFLLYQEHESLLQRRLLPVSCAHNLMELSDFP